MKENSKILEKIDRHDGMTVPEGYFADFAARMAQQLEPTPFEKSATEPQIRAPRNFWQRVRPYVYMAAMFAGVWCMLKMFTMITGTPDAMQQPSPTLAEALGNEVFVNDYVLDNLNQYDLMDELMEEGFDFDSIEDEQDFITTQMQMQ